MLLMMGDWLRCDIFKSYMDNSAENYRHDIDFLKGIAILAVMFYHVSLVQSAYLGVDLFFVISGFLLVPRMCRRITDSTSWIRCYLELLKRQLLRFWPLVILASVVCLLIGWGVGMLPDDFENLNETIVASNLMSNNLLSFRTIRDYWSVRADFQPLMHLWYLGILFEFCLVTPLILFLTRWGSRKMHLSVYRSYVVVLGLLSVVSLVIYLDPSTSMAARFYLLPARYFEMAVGGIAALMLGREHEIAGQVHGISGQVHEGDSRKDEKRMAPAMRWVYYIVVLGLIFFFFIALFDNRYEGMGNKIIPIGSPQVIPSGFLMFSRIGILLVVVALSVVAVSINGSAFLGQMASRKSPLCWLGKMSLSIYIWHQIFLAFERNFFSHPVGVGYVAVYFVVTLAVSYLTYTLIEKRLVRSWKTFFLSAVASACVSALAFYFYCQAGIVRDVPEMQLYKGKATRKMHGKYVMRTWDFCKGYFDNGKYNVCAIGNSFTKDFVNILMESKYKDSVNLIMAWDFTRVSPILIRYTDYLFFFGDIDSVPDFARRNIPKSRVYGIGTKNYGDCNGVFYHKRHSKDYFNQSFKPHQEYVDFNNLWKSKWKDHYINLFEMSLLENGETRIFTPEHQYMSQDCEHLTQPGAMFFAERIDFSKIFRSKRQDLVSSQKKDK